MSCVVLMRGHKDSPEIAVTAKELCGSSINIDYSIVYIYDR